jgi:hypothetical protein
MTNETLTKELEDELPKEKPSRRMLRNWAKRIAQGEARAIPVYVGGSWSLQIMRGKKRRLQLELGQIN